jgi:hypothetical protein
MRNYKQVIIGIVIGISIAVAGFTLKDKYSAKSYMVHSVKSHYSHDNANSQTDIVVYVKGNSGHVMEVFCAFPPDFRLTDEEMRGGWKVKVTSKVAEKFLLGQVSYRCERVE